MYAAALIVFREVLEAALVISIVLAASRGVHRRGLMAWTGCATGLAGAAIVAVFADAIAGALEGMGQEMFNAAVLVIAVAMLAWHNIWMARHASSMVTNLRSAGSQVQSGEKSLYFLGVLVAVALLREGSEVVLFLYGVAANGSSGLTMLNGGLAGLAAGIVFGVALYLGLLRIPARYLFQVTGWMILLLAAGMASQAVGYLMQAGVIADQAALWNTAATLPPQSALGQLLHAFIGYEASPAPLQVGAYLATLFLIVLGMKFFGQGPSIRATAST